MKYTMTITGTVRREAISGASTMRSTFPLHTDYELNDDDINKPLSSLINDAMTMTARRGRFKWICIKSVTLSGVK